MSSLLKTVVNSNVCLTNEYFQLIVDFCPIFHRNAKDHEFTDIDKRTNRNLCTNETLS